MKVDRWKRLLSVVLSLAMVFSFNVSTFAVDTAPADAANHDDEIMTVAESPEPCAPNAHVFDYAGKPVQTLVEASCTAEGLGVFACTVCGWSDIMDNRCLHAIPKGEHKADTTDEENGTYTVADYEEAGSKVEEKPVWWDIKVTDEVKAADCQHGKLESLKYCSVCKEIFDLTYATEGKLEHAKDEGNTKYADELVPPDCHHPARKKPLCKWCNEPIEKEAEWVNVEDGAPEHAQLQHQWNGEPYKVKDQEDGHEQPNCSGQKYYPTCSLCGDKDAENYYYDDSVKVGEHDISGVNPTTQPATCVSGSVSTAVCKTCGEEIQIGEPTQPDSTAHKYPEEYNEKDLQDGKWVITVEGDCVTNRIARAKCEYCGQVIESGVNASPTHDFGTVDDKHAGPIVDIPEVPGNCTTPGKAGGKQCSACKKTTVEPHDTQIDPDNHDYVDNGTYLVEPTCSKGGVGEVKCSRCGDIKSGASIPAGHVFDTSKEPTATKEPTCTEPGWKEWTCERYNASPELNKCDVEEGRTHREPVDPIPHTEVVQYRKDVHCDQQYQTRTVCSVCGTVVTDWHDTTKEDEGKQVKTVTDPKLPDVTIYQVDEVAGTEENQDFFKDEGEIKECKKTELNDPDAGYVAPTCTTAGSQPYECSVCHRKDYPVETVAALGHVFREKSGDDYTGAEVAPTYHDADCTHDGYWTRKCQRDNCPLKNEGEGFTDVVVEVKDIPDEFASQVAQHPAAEPARGHRWEEKPEVKSTCTTAGHSAYKECSVCHATEGKVDYELDETNHEYEIDGEPLQDMKCPGTDGKSGQDGIVKYTCKCGASTYALVKSQHCWGEPENSQDPTCTEAGKATRTCTSGEVDGVHVDGCGATEEVEVPALGHKLKTEPVVKNATCYQDGSFTYQCERYGQGGCTEEKVVVIPKTNDHVLEANFVEATCTEPASVGLKCKNPGCPYVEENKVITGDAEQKAELGKWYQEAMHWTDEDIQDSGTHKTEYDTFMGKLVPAPAKGHAWDRGEDNQITTVEKTPATCTKEGVVDRTCKYCNYTETDVTIPNLGGHQWSKAELVEATCQHGAQLVRTCQRGGCKEGEDGKPATDVEKLDVTHPDVEAYKQKTEHNWKQVGEALQTVTCKPGEEKDGIIQRRCTWCGTTEYALLKWDENHQWGEDAVVKVPVSCTEDGLEEVTCDICGKTREITVPKWNHDKTKTDTKSASCTASGKTTVTCERCGKVLSEDILPQLDHTFGQWVAPEGKKRATCGEDGYKIAECSVCNSKYGDIIPEKATGEHDFEDDNCVGRDVQYADCTHAARVANHCKVCGAETDVEIITDENKTTLLDEVVEHYNEKEPGSGDTARTELEKAIVPKAALGHQESRKMVAHSCTEDGYVEVSCTREDNFASYEKGCGKTTWREPLVDAQGTALDPHPAEGHHWEEREYKAATCVEDGNQAGRQCAVCGQWESETLVIPKDEENGHDFENGEIVEDDAIDCAVGGKAKKQCALCKKATEEYEVQPGEHKYEVKVLYKDSATQNLTTESAGNGMPVIVAEFCQRASCTDKVGKVVSVFGTNGYCPEHGLVTVDADHTKEAQDPTCTDAGWTKGQTCPEEGCGKTILESMPVNPMGHTYEKENPVQDTDYTVTKTETPTCQHGTVETWQCKRCDATEEHDDGKIAEHVYEDELVKATCHTPASVKHLCKWCGEPDPETPETVIPGSEDPNNHVWGDDGNCVYGDATVPEDWGKCPTHGWVKGKVLEAKQDPTCTGTGKTAKLGCSVEDCDEVIKESEEIGALGHEDSGEMDYTTEGDSEPTCGKAGTGHKKCQRCEKPYGDPVTVPATGAHDWKPDTARDATCVSPAVAVEKCSVCGETQDVPIPGSEPNPDAHKFDGDIEGVCEYCEKTAEECGWAKCPSHGWVKWVEFGEVEPSCTGTGMKAGTKCSAPGCDHVFKQPEMVEALGHKPYEDTDDPTHYHVTKEPTCVDAGEKTILCSVCQQETDTKVSIDPTGNHDYGQTQFEGPSCEHGTLIYQECTVCHDKKTVQELGTPLGHDFDAEGNCTRCDATAKVTTSGKAEGQTQENSDGSITYRLHFETGVNVDDEELKVVEMGIMYITDAGYDAATVEDDLKLTFENTFVDDMPGYTATNSNPLVKVQKKTEGLGNKDNLTKTFGLGKDEAAKKDLTVHMRGYIITQKGNLYSIHYADVISASYNTATAQ